MYPVPALKSLNMPPAPALATSQPFSGDCDRTLILTFFISSLSFIFVSVLFFACRSIIRRHRPTHDNSTFRLSRLLSNEKWSVRKRASPTVSTPPAQSTIVSSSPHHLNIISEIGPPPTCGRTVSLLSCLRLLRKSLAPNLFSHQPNGFNGNEDARPEKHLPLSYRTESVADTDVDPEPDICVPDTIDIHSIHSADDALFKIETPMIPFIILSSPSSEHFVGNLPPPVSPDDDLLGPDGTFRSTGPAANDTHDLSVTTHPVIVSRLRERRKRYISFPSPDVLSTPGMAYWPRWF